MRKALKMFIILGCVVCLLASCIKDTAICEQEMAYGQPDTVLLTVGYTLGKMDTKSAIDERLVDDINIYVVDASDKVVACGYFENETVSLRVGIYENVKYRIYALANAGEQINVSSLSEIESIKYRISDISQIMNSSGAVLMSGVTTPQLLSYTKSITVELKRCVSKIVLNANFSGLNSDVKIDINRVALKNVPNSVLAFSNSRISDEYEAIDGHVVENPTADALAQGLVFYQYENMQGNLQPNNTSQAEKVWSLTSIYSRICSYVELSGKYTSSRKEGEILYRFYLGTDMLSNYDVIRNSQHNITVNFNGDGAIDENTWRVDNSNLTQVIDPEIEFEENSKILYDGEETTLLFSRLLPEDSKIDVVSLDESVVQIISATEDGVKIKALKEGSAIIRATINGTSVSTDCSIVVEKLRIVASIKELEAYNHFNYDIGYTIYPQHASSMNVVLKSDCLGVGKNLEQVTGFPTRVQGNKQSDGSFDLKISITGREDVYDNISCSVKDPSISDYISVNMNYGAAEDVVRKIDIDVPSHVDLDYTLVPVAMESRLTGTISENMQVDIDNKSINFTNPCGANGKFLLTVSFVADDNTLVNLTSNIEVYETVYLVGISKTINRETVSKDKYVYENEIVAQWLAHPDSKLYVRGIITDDINIPFKYDGVTYNDKHTGITETFDVEFERGETYDYALDGGTFVYNGSNAPLYYLEYFNLTHAGNSRYQIDEKTKIHYYVYSKTFFSGYSKTPSPDWKTIFGYVYGN